MSHEFSLKCYLDARNDPGVPAPSYADLRALLGYFRPEAPGVEPGPDNGPPRFEFGSVAPPLLIVEDDEHVALLLRDRLVSNGYPDGSIVGLASGEEAVRYVRSNPVAVAVVDVKLSGPGMMSSAYTSGLQVVREIKAASPAAKVVVISGFATFGMVREAICELRASYFLKKPFKLADLVRIVHWGVEQVLGAGVLEAVRRGAGPEASDGSTRQGERLLVVDDDEAVAEGLSLALSEAGYETSVAPGGQAALDALGSQTFDAVLLDIKMPDVDGLEVLRRIRNGDPDLIVLILTGVSDEDIAREALRLGATEFLGKPCDLELLQFTLEHAFAQRRA